MKSPLKTFWAKQFSFNWLFGTILLLSVCIPRFLLVLQANMTGNYSSIGAIMIISAIIPFLFLSRNGLKKIGIVKSKNYQWLIYAFILGTVISATIFAFGKMLYSDSISNWYVYIGRSYNIDAGLTGDEKLVYFIIFAITGMIFSPIGEELFFRGIVHSSFSASFGENKATVIDGLAFALTHLAHFGIIYISGTWKFLWIPSILWVIAMFITSFSFILFKNKSGSILGAILGHAGFNLSMIYLIFYHL